MNSDDIQCATGSLQLCAGQPSGREAAVHTMKEFFKDDKTKGMVLVDATNAFHSLNRAVALHNIQRLCPSVSTILIILTTTPLIFLLMVMSFIRKKGLLKGILLQCHLATVFLIWILNALVTQVSYANDAAACNCGKISDLCALWNRVISLGPIFGYFPNAKKTCLITKAQFCSIGKEFFHDIAVNVTTGGRPHPGAPVGTPEYVESFTKDKILNWISEIDTLSSVATSEPHAAYSCFIHGLISCWLYVSRIRRHIKFPVTLLTKFISALSVLDPLFSIHYLPFLQDLVFWASLHLTLYH